MSSKSPPGHYDDHNVTPKLYLVVACQHFNYFANLVDIIVALIPL